MIIYLLRHGDILNPRQILYLQLPGREYSLSPLGQQQILMQSQRLKDKQVKAIYHSGLLRAKQSAEIIESVLNTGKVVTDNRLMDNYSPVQGVALSEFDLRYHGNLYHQDLQTEGGESMEDVKKRMLAAFKELYRSYSEQAIVAVSHGDPIGIIWLIAENKPLERQYLGNDRNPVPGISYPVKGSVTVLEFDGENLKKMGYWPPG